MLARATQPIATLENAFRVATRIAAETDADMQVIATGQPDRPYVAERANNRREKVIARIIRA